MMIRLVVESEKQAAWQFACDVARRVTREGPGGNMLGIRTVSAVSGTAVIIPNITNATVATIHPLPFIVLH
jgi:hypothetical protein